MVFKPQELVLNSIIEPVPTDRTKGIIVWTSIYGHVIVGPTAEDVGSKTDVQNDEETIERLRSFGQEVIPELKNADYIGSYSGLRPATEHRDY